MREITLNDNPGDREPPAEKLADGGSAFEAELLAARAGSGWAYDSLFRQHAGAVRAFARLRGAEDPDGLANSVLFDAFRQLDRFQGDADRFRAWIFTIARNKVIDEHRRRNRRPVSIGSLDPTGDAPPGSPVVASAEAAVVGGLDPETVAVFNMLTDDQREVLVLRFVVDLTIDQTADVMNKPVTAVKALQRRALSGLRRRLDDQVVSK